MATSGTYNAVTFPVWKLLEKAAQRCSKPLAELTAENIQTAIDEFNLMFAEYANRGLKLWAIEETYVPLYYGRRDYPLDENTIDVLNDPQLRTPSRATDSGGTATSSAGGTVEYAFDGDLETACTQVSPGGNIKYDFVTEVILTYIGILPNATGTLSLNIEASMDDVNWQVIKQLDSATYTNEVWVWFPLNETGSYRYWRLRERSTGTLDLRELYLSSTYTDVSLPRFSRDSYSNMPNKNLLSRPTQYWWDRERVQPVMVLWPVPNQQFWSLYVMRKRMLQDVTAIAQDVECPRRWWNALVEGLAKRLVRCGVGDPARLADIDPALKDALFLAENEEQDSGEVTMIPNLRGYSR